ncbi:MAG TPA: LLM class flavin-dependent oxidoreductase [Streptosporangiaceae bacterium]|jgi:alkanesulfonate monooxygenase SsuD/methylene tetrahydromethanopterin reductase-like flavin-dependent oxidoreductase (luciferase family)|nr:LLM class flavin-dependent oxidoreductase [Streptosporangiaceae bacterium]
MKYGISLLPDCRPAHRTPADYFADSVRIAEVADDVGYGYVKMTEHYMKDYGGYCPSPLTYLSAVAVRTRQIRLMTGGIQASFHHPIQIAAQTAMVDAISGGRMEVGFARAWLPYEFDAFGIALDESRARFTDTVLAVRRLWTEEKVTERGEFFAYQDVTSLPQPTQQPHPPVWVAAVRSRQSFSWIAEQGFGLLVTPPPKLDELVRTAEMVAVYNETFADAHGGSGRQPRVALSVPLYVAPTDAQAWQVAEPALREYLQVWGEAADSWSGTTSSDYPSYGAIGEAMRHLDVDDLRRTGTAVIGSPDSVMAQISELRRLLGIDTFLWQVDFGGQSLQTMEPSVRLFATEVIPALR